MLIREYQPSDVETLISIFRDAIITTGSTAYNAEQIKVWSSYPEDIEEFRQLLSQGITYVAVHNNQLVAFGQLNPSNHIAYLYTASDFARLGYATKIYQNLEAQAIKQGVQHLHTNASRISKYFFLKMGFYIVEAEIVERKKVWLERFKMEKILT
ncbi:MAG TPA: GNAT family N-acetyltransferase [Oculatellaceae cyanobacterium]|jgi:putative acetyltransferase